MLDLDLVFIPQPDDVEGEEKELRTSVSLCPEPDAANCFYILNLGSNKKLCSEIYTCIFMSWGCNKS